MNYPNKTNRTDQVKDIVQGNLEDLHPTDEAQAYREVEAWAGKRAADCEERNDRDGVPERPEIAELDDDGDYVRPGVEL